MSAARVYLVSSSHSDYKAAAGSRLSDWAKSLPGFNLLLWYYLLWVITAVPNQLVLTCIYKKTKQERKKKRINCSYPLALQKIDSFLPHTHNSIFVSSLVCSFYSDCGIWRVLISTCCSTTCPWIWFGFMSEPRPDICVSFFRHRVIRNNSSISHIEPDKCVDLQAVSHDGVFPFPPFFCAHI